MPIIITSPTDETTKHIDLTLFAHIIPPPFSSTPPLRLVLLIIYLSCLLFVYFFVIISKVCCCLPFLFVCLSCSKGIIFIKHTARLSFLQQTMRKEKRMKKIKQTSALNQSL